jgi:protein-disulfide isomerase
MTKSSFRITLPCAMLALAAPLILTAQNSPNPVATVDGQPIYEEELMSVAGTTLLELRNQEYKVKSDALDKLVLRRLIEAEARKKGLTAEEFLQREVDSKVAEPSDDEAKGYYLAGRNQTTLPFDQVKSQVKQLLKNSEIQQAREKYADSLRVKADVAILLRPPKLEIGYDPARVRGDSKAPVTIVEFADFQCPYCKKAQGTLNDLLIKYHGQLRLAYRDFPLGALHPQAQMAAEASRCAGEQGKFWEYHDALFADQAMLNQAALVETAQSLGMDRKLFESCLATGKFKAQIEQDVQDGAKAGVAGTPGFFINGVFVNGAQPAAEFEKIIDGELAALGKRNLTRASR